MTARGSFCARHTSVRLGVVAVVFGLAMGVAQGVVSAQPAPDDAQKAEALSLFEQGKEAYKAGRFADAAKLLESAYQKFPEPVLLYNLARAYEGSADFPRAIDAYDRYLKEATDVADRAALEQRLAALRANEAEKAKLQAERDAAAERAEEASKRKAEPAPTSSPSPVPWIITGVGVAGLGVGAVLGAVALSKNDGRSQVEYAENRPAAEDLALGATVAFIAGGVVTGAGVLWGVIDVATSGKGTEEGTVSLQVGPLGVRVIGAF